MLNENTRKAILHGISASLLENENSINKAYKNSESATFPITMSANVGVSKDNEPIVQTKVSWSEKHADIKQFTLDHPDQLSLEEN